MSLFRPSKRVRKVPSYCRCCQCNVFSRSFPPLKKEHVRTHADCLWTQPWDRQPTRLPWHASFSSRRKTFPTTEMEDIYNFCAFPPCLGLSLTNLEQKQKAQALSMQIQVLMRTVHNVIHCHMRLMFSPSLHWGMHQCNAPRSSSREAVFFQKNIAPVEISVRWFFQGRNPIPPHDLL